MCCCFPFSFSEHTLDDVCLSLVFKTVLNYVTFDNCGRFWKCAKQKIMYGSSSSHTQKGSMFFRPSPPDISYWDFLIAKRKKVIDRFSLKGLRGGGGGGGAYKLSESFNVICMFRKSLFSPVISYCYCA